MGSSERVIAVEILGQRYPIRSALDEQYVAELAAYVDQKMRAAADVSPGTDSVRLAVLTALNIADEFFRCRDSERLRQAVLEERTAEVERLVDRVLGTRD